MAYLAVTSIVYVTIVGNVAPEGWIEDNTWLVLAGRASFQLALAVPMVLWFRRLRLDRAGSG